MVLVDTFLFSEPFEIDLLWIKLNVEDQGIAEWVAVENSYTFQGEFKGTFLSQMLETDQRFVKFRDRITVIRGSIKPGKDFENKPAVFDEIAFTIEFAQRELARDYIVNKYGDTARVFISDVDESLDISDECKRLFFWRKLQGNELVRVPRNRFWYDYDNYWLKVSASPVVSVGLLRNSNVPLGKIRNNNMGHLVNWRHWICFEYSSCFSEAFIKRKFATQSHTGYLISEIENSITCNHRPISSQRSEALDLHVRWWMKKVKLTPRNSPAFVRQNLEKLKTYVIPSDYEVNRGLSYPQYFSNTFPKKFFMLGFRSAVWTFYRWLPFFLRLLNLGRYQNDL